MVLACPWSSLPMMLKLLSSMGCPKAWKCLCIGDGCFKCSLLLSPSVLPGHLKQPSPIHGHSQASGHPIDDNNFNIIGREDWEQARTIKESIYIRVSNPTLNQNIGKYNLNHIWDRVHWFLNLLTATAHHKGPLGRRGPRR